MASAALIWPLTYHWVVNLQNDRFRFRRKEQQEAVKEKLQDQLPSPAKISFHLKVQRCLEADAEIYLPDLQFKLIWNQHSILDQFQSFSTRPAQYPTCQLTG
jgi:hypothetical protein